VLIYIYVCICADLFFVALMIRQVYSLYTIIGLKRIENRKCVTEMPANICDSTMEQQLE